jgi:hypothetical protein
VYILLPLFHRFHHICIELNMHQLKAGGHIWLTHIYKVLRKTANMALYRTRGAVRFGSSGSTSAIESGICGGTDEVGDLASLPS